ncbi:MAG: cadherin-like beta sandwich domain-containing protein [Syntrophomonas sp.]|nr:cadherin-like beta sandwich domain-containing protein [Syntrophomonas sp.]
MIFNLQQSLSGSNNRIRINANTLKSKKNSEIIDEIISPAIAAVEAGATPPCYQYAFCPDINTIQLCFDKNLVSNLDDFSTAILFARDGTEFAPLSSQDSVWIDMNNIIVKLGSSLHGENNKIAIIPQSIKDKAENLQSMPITIDDICLIDDELSYAIEQAQEKLDSATEGSEPGQYLPGSRAVLQEAIETARLVRDNPAATPDERSAALLSLNDSVTAFDAAKVVETSAVFLESARTDITGRYIILEFNKNMASPLNKHKQFSVIINNEAGSFSSACLGENHCTIELALSGQEIVSGDSIQVSYNEGDIESEEHLPLKAFNNFNVTNLVESCDLPDKAMRLENLSVLRINSDSSETELLNGFNGDTSNYSIQVSSEVESVRIVASVDNSATVRIYFNNLETDDGIILLGDGTNTIRAVVSEDNKDDRVYTLTILRGNMDECFIATAAFGSKFTWPVALLRSFRDQYLMTGSWGTAFVEFYYRHSPPIAAIIADNEALKLLVRVILTPVIALVYLLYHPLLLVILLLSLMALTMYCFRQRTVDVRE